jgi:hypothetical protein
MTRSQKSDKGQGRAADAKRARLAAALRSNLLKRKAQARARAAREAADDKGSQR